MRLKDEFSILRSIPLFASMESTKLKLLAFSSDRVIFRPGENLYSEGELSDAAYVILEGNTEIFQNSGKGKVKIGESGAQSLVGEIAILSDQPRSATITATTEVEALRITKDRFHALLMRCPGTLGKILRILGDRMAEAS